MPFFIRSHNPNKKINPSTTLQVRIPNETNKRNKSKSPYAKRVLLSASLNGSLTIEAALCLILMVFAMVLLILPMKIMDTRRQLQAGLENINEELSRYTYIKYRLEQGGRSGIEGADEFTILLAEQVIGGITEGYVRNAVAGWIDTDQVRNLTMKRSSILEDGETLDLILDYEIELPFPVLAAIPISQSVRSCRRAWIGKAGTEGEGGLSGDDDDRIVYIGRHGTRYHDSSSCHYLANQLTSVSYDALAALRNESGGIYRPCSVCGAGADGTSAVYIMPNGNRYHRQPRCTAIIAYAQAVKLSEVIHLGGCSYCTK